MPEVAQQIDPPRDALCLGCNYPLRGLADRRCPECGQDFDPNDADTFITGGRWGRLARWWLKPTRRWIDLCALLAGLMLIVGHQWFRRRRFTIGYWQWCDVPLPRWLDIELIQIQLFELAVFAWFGLLVVWMILIAGRRRALKWSARPQQKLLLDRPRRRFAAWVFLLSAFFAGVSNDECYHADHFKLYGWGSIDHGQYVENCPQMIHRVHLFGNWYAHFHAP
jgi:hypothetical protein